MHKEQANLRVFSGQNINILLGVDRGSENEKFVANIDTVHALIVDHGGVDGKGEVKFALEDGEEKAILLGTVVEGGPVVLIVWGLELVFKFGV
jgi:hypothetical protein